MESAVRDFTAYGVGAEAPGLNPAPASLIMNGNR